MKTTYKNDKRMRGWDYTCISLVDTKIYEGVCSANKNHKYEGSVIPRDKKCTANKCKGTMTYKLRKEKKELSFTDIKSRKRPARKRKKRKKR